jgi:H+/Cl- antiporter ClcA
MRLRLQGSKFLASVIPTVLAGTIVGELLSYVDNRYITCISQILINRCHLGLVNYALPLTVGNGNQVLAPMVSYAIQGKLSKTLLICSAFAKAFTLGVSMNGGFVGGFVFPIISIGLISGNIMTNIKNYSCFNTLHMYNPST